MKYRSAQLDYNNNYPYGNCNEPNQQTIKNYYQNYHEKVSPKNHKREDNSVLNDYKIDKKKSKNSRSTTIVGTIDNTTDNDPILHEVCKDSLNYNNEMAQN